MITVSDTRLMTVPDFGVTAGDESMVALKKAIEAAGDYTIKIVDLPAAVCAEHEGEVLTEAKVIELSARKLEELASCDDLIWDGSDNLEQRKSCVIRHGLSHGNLCRLPEPEAEPEQPDETEDDDSDKAFEIDDITDPDNINDIFSRDFSDVDDDTNDWGAPDVVVGFGKSAMLAGGLGKRMCYLSIRSMTRSGRGRSSITSTANLPGSIIAISTNMSDASWRR